ncbi:hypothetical protein EV401DRAFT_2071138 [Pisolithus croceorrhizus]|nr:hypothetical protein EV401DRAFT_2071138 [Pisolithus croceorrhizus]
MPRSTAGLSTTSSTLSSQDIPSSVNAREDRSTSPISSYSQDVSVDVSIHPMDMDENVCSTTAPALPPPEKQSRRTLRKRNPVIDKSALRFRPIPTSTSTSRSRSNNRGASEEDSSKQKQTGPQTSHRTPPEREARVRELKNRALSIPSTGKTPATMRQRMVMQMVYDEITPYPDEAWVSQLGIIINREYHQVKNWFSNQRQKDARDSRQQSPSLAATSALEASLCKINCDGREMRVRVSALDSCSAEAWTDAFFDEVVMIHNFRLLAKLSQDEARAALHDSNISTTDTTHAHSRLP